MKINIVWLRRDLRLDDNSAIDIAVNQGLPIQFIFIFDEKITDELPATDSRISFIYLTLKNLNYTLNKIGGSLLILKGNVNECLQEIISKYPIDTVFANQDYEPYAIERDNNVDKLLKARGVKFRISKDQVIFEKDEIVKSDGKPYTVFTPYKKRWLEAFEHLSFNKKKSKFEIVFKNIERFPSINEFGFSESKVHVESFNGHIVESYHKFRDYPWIETSNLSPHLRFGTMSIRQIIEDYGKINDTFLSELIWREFFMQILFHFPDVVKGNFKQQYDKIIWKNNEYEFNAWCQGKTGYSIVDAGMRQLNQTGYMHNRVRMIAASFLCKHLLIDWRWGEAYFAKKLLDFELSSNNGNWQWAAGTGCDAVPYFRIFNPNEQQKKYDSDFVYCKKWIPELGSRAYPLPIVDHSFARNRALGAYKNALKK